MSTASVDELRQGVQKAYERFLLGYREWGAWRYPGWPDDDPASYRGPVLWTEADCRLRFALELEKTFPQQVHLEVEINNDTRSDFDKDVEPRQKIDIVVADMSSFPEGPHPKESFRAWTYDIFIEAKFFKKGGLNSN